MTNPETDARILLADERGRSETDFFRSYHTFTFGTYQAEGRDPFGALCLLNEDTLRAGASLSLHVASNTDVLLIPIVGGLEYQTEVNIGSPVTDFLEPGQVGQLSLSVGMSYTITNPYESESINILTLWLTNSNAHFSLVIKHTAFDLSQKNTLLPLFDASGQQGFIGQYDGRAEGTFTVGDPAKGVFVFVLQGVFEVANRLVHAKDGLALRYVNEVEFEALSNDATLFIVAV